MQIELVPIKKEEKNQLKLMLGDYFKEIDPSKIVQTKSGENIDYPYLDLYWEEPSRSPFFVLYDKELAGLALVNEWIHHKEYNAQKAIAEFYIKPAFRRKGIGKIVAFKLFRKYPGKWEIKHSSIDTKAISFWKTIIHEFTNNNYLEIENGNASEIYQLFEVPS